MMCWSQLVPAWYHTASLKSKDGKRRTFKWATSPVMKAALGRAGRSLPCHKEKTTGWPPPSGEAPIEELKSSKSPHWRIGENSSRGEKDLLVQSGLLWLDVVGFADDYNKVKRKSNKDKSRHMILFWFTLKLWLVQQRILLWLVSCNSH